MCLAVPSRILRIDGMKAYIDVMGTESVADLSMLPDAAVGEYVMVHAGFAIERYSETEALETISLFKELAQINGTD